LVLLLPMSLVIARGNQSSGGSGSGKSLQGESITLWMPGGEEDAQYKNQMALYEQIRRDTGLNLTVEYTPFAVYDDKCNAALRSNTGPDILLVNSVTLASFADLGYLQETGSLLTGSTIKREDFFPGLWKHIEYNGKLYGLPIDTGTRALIYNKTMLAENGIRFGKETSWQDFMAAVKACTKTGSGSNNVFGYAYVGGEPWMLLYEGLGMFMLQNGGKALSEDLRTANFSSPEVKEAAKFFYDLQNSGACPRDSVTITDGNVINDMFVSGRVAMITGGHWALDYILERNPKFEVGVTLLKNKQTASSTGGWTLEIANKARNPRAAWTVFEYIFKPENLVLFTNIMPATIAASKLTMTDPKYDIYKEVLSNSTHPIPINKNLPEVAKMLQTEMQGILLNNTSLDAGLANLDRNVTALMRR